MPVFAVAVNFADVVPAAIVTVPGTTRFVLLDDKVATDPPVGAALSSVNVHVVADPKKIVVAAHAKDEI